MARTRQITVAGLDDLTQQFKKLMARFRCWRQ